MFDDLRDFLFLILFFKLDWFCFRYPMDIFLTENIKEDFIFDEWEKFNKRAGGNLQLYLHSIHCWTRCSYCDCKSFPLTKKEEIKKYKEYLCNNIEKYGSKITKKLDSLYFWWGTFNLWSDKDIKDICLSVKDSFSFSSHYTWQVEIQPYYLWKNTLTILKEVWVTDIMLWIQSISERLNSLNNRKFDLRKIDKAIDDIIALWFRKVSFDIMYNLPHTRWEEIINDLDYIYEIGLKLKNAWIRVNFEPNRWDISLKTTFASNFLSKYWKEKFFSFCNYYIKTSEKFVKIVDRYIDKRFLWVFDTKREEIEERKENNTAIIWIWVSSVSCIPWVIVYEDMNYHGWKELRSSYKWYKLYKSDELLFFVLENLNLNRWIEKDTFNLIYSNSSKFRDFYNYYKDSFYENKQGKIFINTKSDKEIDLLNIYLIDDKIRQEQYLKLLSKWEKLWFNKEELRKYTDIFLEYYYNRNKLYW